VNAIESKLQQFRVDKQNEEWTVSLEVLSRLHENNAAKNEISRPTSITPAKPKKAKVVLPSGVAND
jgi:hypothetical protein